VTPSVVAPDESHDAHDESQAGDAAAVTPDVAESHAVAVAPAVVVAPAAVSHAVTETPDE